MDISYGLEWLERQSSMLRTPPVHHHQGEAAEGPSGKYCSYTSPGASAHQLPVSGAREGKGRECPGSDRPLHPVYPGIFHLISDGPDIGKGLMEQFHHPLWVARENPFGPREEL